MVSALSSLVGSSFLILSLILVYDGNDPVIVADMDVIFNDKIKS